MSLPRLFLSLLVAGLCLAPATPAATLNLTESDSYFVGLFTSSALTGSASDNVDYLAGMTPAAFEETSGSGGFDFFLRSLNFDPSLPASGAANAAAVGDFSTAGVGYVLASKETFSWVWYVGGVSTDASIGSFTPTSLTLFSAGLGDPPASSFPPDTFTFTSTLLGGAPEGLYSQGVPDGGMTLALLAGSLAGVLALRRRRT